MNTGHKCTEIYDFTNRRDAEIRVRHSDECWVHSLQFRFRQRLLQDLADTKSLVRGRMRFCVGVDGVYIGSD
jgi:hypothetical protein